MSCVRPQLHSGPPYRLCGNSLTSVSYIPLPDSESKAAYV
uniref:Uncharacterized protein n=1 Tax=Triticum urartu TaxID=4572 RepID=A0A8R7PNB0_TRIUA